MALLAQHVFEEHLKATFQEIVPHSTAISLYVVVVVFYEKPSFSNSNNGFFKEKYGE